MRARVCSVDDVAPGEALRVEVDGHRLAVVRIDDDFYVIGDTCSHADVSLSEGEVLTAEREIECWKHGSTFSLLTGEPQCLPATRAVPTYRVAIEGGEVVVEGVGVVEAEGEGDAAVDGRQRADGAVAATPAPGQEVEAS
jgi:3-phenylpropionate/trans-cinnamate dioxygenase ferredoxin component